MIEAAFQYTDFRTYVSPSPTKDWNAPREYFSFGRPLFHQKQNSIAGSAVSRVTSHRPIENGGQEHNDSASGDASPFTLQPPFHHSPNSRSHEASLQYEQLLDRIEDTHEELRDARDELVGSRFRLRTKRRELGAAHIKTVTQAGVGIDLLKRYLLDNNTQLPENIASVLSEVDELRDSLGKLEVEYEEAEEKYTLEEWRYTQKESKFVENLNADGLLDNASTNLSVNHVRTESSRQLVFGPLDPTTTAVTTPHPICTPQNFPDALKGSSDSSMLRDFEAEQPLTPVRRDPIPISQDVEHSPSPLQPNLEQGLPSRRLSWSDTFEHINSWLWKTLESSSLERQRLNGMLVINNLSDDAMLNLVQKHWDSDISRGDVFHTGDTTKSPEDTSDTTSVSPMTKLLENFALERSDVKTASALPLLPHERVVDALEPVDFPSTIEPKDLIDAVPEHLVHLVRCQSALSVSTQPTTMTHASSRVGDPTISIDENGSFTSSEDLDTIRQGEPTDMGRSRSERQDYSMAHKTCNAAAVSFERQPDVQESTHKLSTGPFDSSQRLDLNHDQSMCPVHTAVKPHPHDSEQQFPTTTIQSDEQITAFPSDPYKLPSGSPEATLSSPSPKHRNSTHFEPFIRIDSPESWKLPLLRLTPYSNTQADEDAHRLAYLPFVSYEAWSSQLPGPSELPSFFLDNIYR